MGTGTGHGIVLIFVIGGALCTLIILALLINLRIRRVKMELPDAIA
ncbi:MAG: hypothetical protein MUQ30_19695 [Anaerolineae bacterium]|nr:hypothetical protein [Anaerolineae bacterium]